MSANKMRSLSFFFFNDPATTEIYTLSLHDALPIYQRVRIRCISELEEVVVVGEVAYTRSRDALSVTQRAGGEATQLAGHRITVYRKQPDGRWLLARDVHTLSPVEK